MKMQKILKLCCTVAQRLQSFREERIEKLDARSDLKKRHKRILNVTILRLLALGLTFTMQKRHSKPLPVILLTIFVDVLGIGILAPVMPILLADPASSHYLLPAGMTVQNGYVLLGYLSAIYPFMQFLAAPILGQLSDKYGRRKILAISLAGTCISYAVFALGIYMKSIPILFISRAFDGITGGNIAVAQAAIADVSAPEERVRNFGLMGATFGFGFIIGPFLGGILSDPNTVSWFNAATPFWFATILSFLNVLAVLSFFPETRKNISKHITIRWAQSLHNIARALQHVELRILFITNFLFQGGFTFFTTFISVYLIQRFDATQTNVGSFFAFIGVWIVITQALVVRPISRKVAEQNVLRFSMLWACLVIPLHFIPQTFYQVFYVTPLLAIGIGLTQANMAALVSRRASDDVQGEVLGINSSVQALAQSIPPVLSGYVAASISPSAPIVVSSVVVCVAWLVFILFFHRTAKPFTDPE